MKDTIKRRGNWRMWQFKSLPTSADNIQFLLVVFCFVEFAVENQSKQFNNNKCMGYDSGRNLLRFFINLFI